MNNNETIYMLKIRPYIYEEDARDNIRKCYFDVEYEYYSDESEFLYWSREENRTYNRDGYEIDGCDIEMFSLNPTPYIKR